MLLDIIMLAFAYLLGSVCCAIIVCKLAGCPDPRTQGSGNPGASNVLRVAGKSYAALTLLGDGLKGFIPVFIAKVAGVPGFTLAMVGLLAVIGHMYPVFFKFKGGKGVATAVGVYFGLSLTLGAITALIWVGLAIILRYASIASLAACCAAVVVTLFIQPTYFLGVLLIAFLVVYRHQGNIKKLRAGTENKLVIKKPGEKPRENKTDVK